MMGKHALGRGLASLIPQATTLTEQVIPSAKREVLELDPSLIRANPRQMRSEFTPEALDDLKQSIREHGILQPVVVTKLSNGTYELIAGERRLRATRELGLKVIPAIVREANEQQKLELALIENVQRADLNPIEEAVAYRALVDEFNLTQDEVATRVGKKRPTVANTLRLLELPQEMVDAIRSGSISKSLGKALLAEVNPSKQRQLFEQMLTGTMTSHEAQFRTQKQVVRRVRSKDANLADIERQLRERFGTKVELVERLGRGKISLYFYSKEELTHLLDRLNDA